MARTAVNAGIAKLTMVAGEADFAESSDFTKSAQIAETDNFAKSVENVDLNEVAEMAGIAESYRKSRDC